MTYRLNVEEGFENTCVTLAKNSFSEVVPFFSEVVPFLSFLANLCLISCLILLRIESESSSA